MSTIKYLCAFVVGAGVGSAATYKLVKDKEERKAQKEINNFKEYMKMSCKYSGVVVENKDDEPVEVVEENKESDNEPVTDYTQFFDTNAITPEVTVSDTFTKIEEPEIFAIPPEEFDSDETFEKRTLVLYSDDVIADDMDNVVENVEELIGEEMLEYFKKSKSNEEYIRNEKLGMDYELLKVTESYQELMIPPEDDIDED